jgi:hypothetical protein
MLPSVTEAPELPFLSSIVVQLSQVTFSMHIVTRSNFLARQSG